MIKFKNVEVMGWEAAIRGMRNPKNSWDKSDSKKYGCEDCDNGPTPCCSECCLHGDCEHEAQLSSYIIGPNDLKLMKALRNAGTDHRKYLRMITVYVDITAPLYWWKEFDTYKIGTVANSCSTMHKIAAKEFTLDDFSCEKLIDGGDIWSGDYSAVDCLQLTVSHLNYYRQKFLETKDKKYWWQMIQLLPTSYNQKRTVMLNYEVLANIYKSRRHHKLDEWSVGFMKFIEELPYSELITGEEK